MKERTKEQRKERRLEKSGREVEKEERESKGREEKGKKKTLICSICNMSGVNNRTVASYVLSCLTSGSHCF